MKEEKSAWERVEIPEDHSRRVLRGACTIDNLEVGVDRVLLEVGMEGTSLDTKLLEVGKTLRCETRCGKEVQVHLEAITPGNLDEGIEPRATFRVAFS